MSDNILSLRGKDYPLVPLQSWTFGDTRWVSRILGVRLDDLDDSAIEQVGGVLLVSVKHAEQDWPQAKVEEFVDSLTIEEIQKAVEAVNPPDSPAATPGPPKTSSDVSTTSPAPSPEGVPV